jgi:hypothetical protein
VGCERENEALSFDMATARMCTAGTWRQSGVRARWAVRDETCSSRLPYHTILAACGHIRNRSSPCAGDSTRDGHVTSSARRAPAGSGSDMTYRKCRIGAFPARNANGAPCSTAAGSAPGRYRPERRPQLRARAWSSTHVACAVHTSTRIDMASWGLELDPGVMVFIFFFHVKKYTISHLFRL